MLHVNGARWVWVATMSAWRQLDGEGRCSAAGGESRPLPPLTCCTMRLVLALLQSLVSSRHRMMYSRCCIFDLTMLSTWREAICRLLFLRPGAAEMRPAGQRCKGGVGNGGSVAVCSRNLGIARACSATLHAAHRQCAESNPGDRNPCASRQARSSGCRASRPPTWRVDDGEVGAVLVLDLHHDLLGPELALRLQPRVLRLDVLLQLLQRGLSLALLVRDQVAVGVHAGAVVLHVQGDGAPGLGAAAHVVELEPHERLHQGCGGRGEVRGWGSGTSLVNSNIGGSNMRSNGPGCARMGHHCNMQLVAVSGKARMVWWCASTILHASSILQQTMTQDLEAQGQAAGTLCARGAAADNDSWMRDAREITSLVTAGD